MPSELLQQNWLALTLLLSAVALLAVAALSPPQRWPLLIVGLASLLLGVGGFELLPEPWGWITLASAVGLLAALVLLLAFTGL